MVDTTIVAPLNVGDLVLVHAGTAIAVVREDPS
jgi:hydrogenase maturation factor